MLFLNGPILIQVFFRSGIDGAFLKHTGDPVIEREAHKELITV